MSDIGHRETVGVTNFDTDLDASADQRADQLCNAFDLLADIEHLRRQRLPAREGQKLSGQLGRPVHRVGNRVDVAAAALVGQVATPEEIGGRTDDREQIVEIVRDAAGELADRLHLLRLTQRFLGLAALGDIDGLRQHGGNAAMLIEHRPHGKIEIPVADRQMQQHLDPHAFTAPDRRKRIGDDLANRRGGGKPGRVPERLADDVGRSRHDSGQRGLVGVDDPAVQVEKPLVLVAGFEHRAQLRLIRFELPGPLPNALLQRFVEAAQFTFGFLGRGDVVGYADETNMPAGRIPARLRFRSHPAPYAIGPAISRFQHKRLQRGFAGDAFIHDPGLVVGVKNCAPVENNRLFVGQTEEIQIGLIGEAARAIQFADPHRHRRAIGDQTKALLALSQQFLRQRAFGDVQMSADQPQRPALFVPFNLRLAGDPPDLSVVRPDDPVFRRIAAFRAVDGGDEMLHRPVAVLGMNTLDPVLVGIDGIRTEAVYFQIFGRAASAVEAVPQVNRDPSDARDLLNAGKIVLAILQQPFGNHPLRRFDHDGDHPGRLAGFVQNRRVVQIHPDLLGPPMPVQRQLLVLVGQGAAAQPHLHDIVVEIGHLRPSLAHLRSQQLRMPAAGEDRIGVVVDHDAVVAPQQHDGHGRPQQGVGDGFEALGPRRERSEAGFRPVESPNQCGKLAAGGRKRSTRSGGYTFFRHLFPLEMPQYQPPSTP